MVLVHQLLDQHLKANGIIMYKEVRDFIERNGATVMYNATYVMNYCTVNETIWIAFNDVEAVQTKASYAKEKGLLGDIARQIPYDDNSVLSQAADQVLDSNHSSPLVNNIRNKHRQLLAIISWSIIAAVFIVLAIFFVIHCRMMRNLISKHRTYDHSAKQLKHKIYNLAAGGHINASVPSLMVYGLADIQAATNRFSIQNYLGQGGCGLDYKAYKLWKDGKCMEFMDSSLDDTHSSCKLMRCLQVALLCVQDVPRDRPTILEVFSMLKNEATDIMIPNKPSFFYTNK